MSPRKTSIISVSSVAGLLAGGVFLAAPAGAHGYVNAPESRSYLCKVGVNTDCGGVQYEPQSLEYLKGFPAAGPSDGQIASAGGQFGGKLDEQSATRWAKTDIAPGPMLFDWTYTAPHSTAKWHYYMTKQGWDQNAPLTRDALELIGEVQHDGSKASTNPDHVIDIPANRSGYHVILAVWDIEDTVNAFYNVIDVNVVGDAIADEIAPTIPQALRLVESDPTSATIAWQPSQDASGDITYAVYRDGLRIGTSTTAVFTDTDLAAESTYSYRVVALDRAGNASDASALLEVRTEAAPVVDVTAPSSPMHLHSMGETETSIDLMWRAATDDVGVAGYRVYRDGQLVRSTSATRVMDTDLTDGTEYRYTVRAIDAAGNESADSNVLVKSTKAVVVPEPTPEPTAVPAPQPSGTWDSRATYAAGAIVTHEGTTYRAVQTHTGVGDPNWITARSLWEPISAVTPAPEPTTPIITPPAPSADAWDSRASYSAGDTVTHEGATYRAVQAHTGVGDPNWILAPSLWSRVS